MQMGRNVTARYPQGDFVVQNTTFTSDFRANTRIIGKPGTHIKPTGSGRAHAFIAPFDLDCLPSMKWAGSEGDETDYNETVLPPTGERAAPEEKLPISDKVRIYPNPNAGQFTVEFSGDEASILLTDMMGRIVWQEEKLTNNRNIIDISAQPKGIYFIQVRQVYPVGRNDRIGGDQIFTEKLIHQ